MFFFIYTGFLLTATKSAKKSDKKKNRNKLRGKKKKIWKSRLWEVTVPIKHCVRLEL